MGAIAAYVRVSSASQSVSTQRDAIVQLAGGRGDSIERWYEECEGAHHLARPELRRLRAAIRRHEISRLYVYAIDRLGRSGIRDTFSVVDEIRSCRCDLVSVADPFAFDSDIALAVLAWSAQQERRRIGERISAARARVEREGGTWGRPAVVDPKTAREIWVLRRRGASVREIGTTLRVGKSTVHTVLSEKGHYARPVFHAAKAGGVSRVQKVC
jgi:DNA invertase Pin-like site-specific DNA recombinase